ncbi:MAG: glycosyl hydrolase family 18 protein [Candidatus Neomarinimicrobiota bacterium]
MIAYLFSQERPPIHLLELEAHREVVVEFARIDSLAAALPPPLPRIIAPSREIIGYLPYWQYDSYPNLDYNLLTQINYFSAELDTNGNIINDHNWPRAELINFVHTRGVKVKLCATLFDWGGTNKIETLLSSSANRQRAIDNLLAEVQAAGADGVDIDFEPLPASQRDNMVNFMQDLTNAVHNNIPGSLVTMATPAVDWSGAWDYNALARIVDGLFIMAYDYHWSSSPTAGPVSPLDGFSWNVRRTVNDYLTKTGSNSSKIVLGLPYYGYDWPVSSTAKYAATTSTGQSRIYSQASSMAETYGSNWDNNSFTPWFNYQSEGIRQVWYDDSLSLSLKYNLALDKDLAGVGMWALGYDGDQLELWGALADHFTAGVPPPKPTTVAAFNNGDGSVTIAITGILADLYQLYASTDGVNFTPYGSYLMSTFEVGNLPADSVVYFKVKASNTVGDGPFSEVFGTVPGERPSRVLIVNSFDRTTGTHNTFDFLRRYGPHVKRLELAFDACSNEAAESGLVNLSSYEAVIWICGEEAATNSSFTPQEQSLIAAYLTSGGNLLVSGSEIGYDLVAQGTTSDRQFYQDYFKATYVADDATGGGYTIIPVAGSILAGLGPFHFDNGQQGTYDVDWPDGIRPTGGASLIAAYQGIDVAAAGGAAIAYEGTFGTGSRTGHLVYLAVGFETIYPAGVRDELMQRFMEFFQVTPAIGPPEKPRYVLYQNFPNPFQTATTIPYELLTDGDVQLSVYNLRGALVRTLVSHYLPAEKYAYDFIPVDAAGRPLASGFYFVTLKVDKGRPVTRKMILQK